MTGATDDGKPYENFTAKYTIPPLYVYSVVYTPEIGGRSV